MLIECVYGRGREVRVKIGRAICGREGAGLEGLDYVRMPKPKQD
jgi:hypothetical protein